MLLSPCVQAIDECRKQWGKFRRLPGGPYLCALRNAVHTDPLVRVEIFLPIELGGAAAGLGVKADEKLGVCLHLRVTVSVEKAGAVRRENVRDAVAVPKYLGAFSRWSSRGRTADSKCGEIEHRHGQQFA